MKAYWFSQKGKAQYGFDGTFEVGPRPYTVKGPIVPCLRGLHASVHPFDALSFAYGATLDLVELDGEIVKHGYPVDKYAASKRTHLKRIDAGPLCHEFARWCALQVVDNWNCPPVVRQWLETGDLTLREIALSEISPTQGWGWCGHGTPARVAVRHAMDDTPWYAARNASFAAENASKIAAPDTLSGVEAMNATIEAQRQKFQELVDQAFAKEETK